MKNREILLPLLLLAPAFISVAWIFGASAATPTRKPNDRPSAHEPQARVDTPRATSKAPAAAMAAAEPSQRQPETETEQPSEAALKTQVGPHFGDGVAGSAEETWNRERYDRQTSLPRQQAVTELFKRSGATDVLRDVQCRETLCRVVLDGRELARPGRADTARKLGPGVAVLENSDDRVVVLVPVETIDGLGAAP